MQANSNLKRKIVISDFDNNSIFSKVWLKTNDSNDFKKYN